jgi:hypothetical protein
MIANRSSPDTVLQPQALFRRACRLVLAMFGLNCAALRASAADERGHVLVLNGTVAARVPA